MPPLNPLTKSCVALAVSQLLALPMVSHAATIEVNFNGDDDFGCSLREAIVSANTSVDQNNGCAIGSDSGTDTITFVNNIFDNTITLTQGELVVGAGKDIEIKASNISGGITIDANFQSRLLNISNATVSIDSMTFTRGGVEGLEGVEGGEYASVNAVQINDSTLTLSNSTLSNNISAYEAVMMDANRSEVTINNSSFKNNSYVNYSGLLSLKNGSFVTLDSVVVSDNQISSSLISISGNDSVTIRDSTFSDNDSTGFMFSLRRNDSSSIVNSTISNNSVGLFLMILVDDFITISNSTISGNVRSGGPFSYAINLTSNKLDLINTTISNDSFPNTFELSNNPFYSGSTSMTLVNSIVASSSGNANCITASNSASLNDITSDSNSIIQGGGCGTQARDVDPLLAPLADNGGPTLTHALLSGSPAVNTGDNVTCEASDQRGETRPLSAENQCDVGSFEFIENIDGAEEDLFVIPLANGRSVIFGL